MNMNMNTSTSTGRRTGSITATIQHAVCENNAGSRLVRQCQYDAAVKSFTSVLKILKPLAAILEQQQQQQNDDNDSSNDNDNDTTDTTTTSNSTVPFKISFVNNNNTTMILDKDDDTDEDTTMTSTKETINDVSVVSPEVTASSSPEVSSSASYTHNKLIASKQHNCSNNNGTASSPFVARKLKYFVFHDPVVIPPESLPSRSTSAATGMNTNDDDYNDDNFDELSLYSSEFFSKFLMIVMYNLALTLHLHALSLSASVRSLSKSDKSSSFSTTTATTIKHIKKLFLRSRKLYELAFEMHLDADVDLLFTLALINNLGLIYYTVNEKDRSTTCFKNMFSTMMYLMDSKEAHSITEWDGLLANAMDILKIGNAVAASAA
mmetsp:Transcript_1629/g.1832  ORF Transcript_1629/g.1832 Transcript_1629/m.1832 type:complete len:378 (+) Transcript_1629:258-1391(+)